MYCEDHIAPGKFPYKSRRSGRVVKAFDSNDLSTSSAIKSFRGQEFESLGRRHPFCF